MKRMQCRKFARVDLAFGGYDVELHSDCLRVSGLRKCTELFKQKRPHGRMHPTVFSRRATRKYREPHLLVINHPPYVAIDPRYTFKLFESDGPVPSILYRSINLVKEAREGLLTLHIIQLVILLIPPEVPGAVKLIIVWHLVRV